MYDNKLLYVGRTLEEDKDVWSHRFTFFYSTKCMINTEIT